jgi:hypothetical protein
LSTTSAIGLRIAIRDVSEGPDQCLSGSRLPGCQASSQDRLARMGATAPEHKSAVARKGLRACWHGPVGPATPKHPG